MIRGTPIGKAVPVNGMMIRRPTAKHCGKKRPVAVPQQADRLIIQAIYRLFTGMRPSIYLTPEERGCRPRIPKDGPPAHGSRRALLTMRCSKDADLRIKKPISGRPEIGAQFQLWIFS